MQLSTTMFMKQKNVGLANTASNCYMHVQHTMFMKQQIFCLLLKTEEEL